MTVIISAGAAAELAAEGTENNPIILWENLAADGAWEAGSGTEIESARFLNTESTYDRWIQTYSGSGICNAKVDLPVSRSFNIACIAAHTISDEGAAVRIQYSPTGGSPWTTVSAGEFSPTDNSAICVLFDGAPSAPTWRIRLSEGTSDEPVAIGALFFGNRWSLPQRIYQGYTPPITPTQADFQSNVSESGNLLGSSVIRKGSSAVANLSHLTPTFIRDAAWTGFQNHFNEGGGSFWVWRPTKYEDAFYGWKSGDSIIPTNTGPKGYMGANLEMRLFDDP